MALSAEALLDRLRIKRQLRRWKVAAIVALTLAVLAFAAKFDGLSGGFHTGGLPVVSGAYIARYHLDGVILDDFARYELLDEIAQDNSVKALLLIIDSPGGSAVGGEELYHTIRRISEHKPVVAVMRSVAASAGYMTAVGADYVIAREGTLTGSIGAIMQSFELVDLAKKLGITPQTAKSGALKASPSPFEKARPEDMALLQTVVDDFFAFFKAIVQERRQLDTAALARVSDGRVLTGRQALELQLIDALGGTQDAITWLETQKNITKDLPVKEVTVKREPHEWLESSLSSLLGWVPAVSSGHHGVLSVWQPQYEK